MIAGWWLPAAAGREGGMEESQARNLQLAKPLELTASCKQVCRTTKQNTVKLKRCPLRRSAVAWSRRSTAAAQSGAKEIPGGRVIAAVQGKGF